MPTRPIFWMSCFSAWRPDNGGNKTRTSPAICAITRRSVSCSCWQIWKAITRFWSSREKNKGNEWSCWGDLLFASCIRLNGWTRQACKALAGKTRKWRKADLNSSEKISALVISEISERWSLVVLKIWDLEWALEKVLKNRHKLSMEKKSSHIYINRKNRKN